MSNLTYEEYYGCRWPTPDEWAVIVAVYFKAGARSQSAIAEPCSEEQQ